MKCLVGGDFILEQNRGWRGDRFEEVLSGLALEVCNHFDSLAVEDRWTFRSILGSNRILDYCVASIGINVISSRPINDLGLRSDHRAVQTCIRLPPEGRLRRQHTRRREIVWNTYPEAANKVQYDRIGTLPILENALCDVGDNCPKEHPGNLNRPLDSAELQRLRGKRRSASTAEKQKEMSKKIWRLTRDQLRRYRTEEAETKTY